MKFAKTTHKTKKKAVDSAKTKLFVVVAVSSSISVFALVAAKSYLNEATYLNRIASAKEQTLEQLKKNKQTASGLSTAYKEFASKDPNLIGGSTSGNGDKDGDNGKLILDALPSKYDFPALASSIEKLLAGYKINSITGVDDSLAQSSTTVASTGPVEIPFTLDAVSDFNGMKSLVESFERSIRPFSFTSIDLKASTANSIQATINAKTYYQPEKTLKLGTKVIK